MANQSSLLKSNFNSNLFLQQTFNFPPNRSLPHRNSLKFNLRISPNLRINCNRNPKLGNTATGRITDDLEGLLLGLYDHHHGCVASAASGGKRFSSSSSRSFIRAPYHARSSSRSNATAPCCCSSSSVSLMNFGYTLLMYGLAFSMVVTFIRALFSVVRFVWEDLFDTSGTTSVLKLQVGLLGSGRSLQTMLNRIAEVADTSSPQPLSYKLTETTLALLRHRDYCIFGYSSVDLKKSVEDGKIRFNHFSIEERGNINKETLVNVNNIKRQSATSQRLDGPDNEYIVITIIVAAKGVHKLPPISRIAQLKEALQKLGSIPSSRIRTVEVLWNPPNENNTLSVRELLEDYPLLHPL